MMKEPEEQYQEFLEQAGEEEFILPYRKAIGTVKRELERISREWSPKLERTLVNEITYRVKTPESCLGKMLRKQYPIELQTAAEKINDIAGIRAVCSFLDDIYRLAEILEADPEFEIIKIKDYVNKPKTSGYQSLHLVVLADAGAGQKRKVEIQIRTQAMNLWAVIEHHFIYKKENGSQPRIEKDLKDCARAIHKIDKKMLHIREKLETNQGTEALR